MTRKVKPLIQLEQLEPRILLSGDGLLNIAPNPDPNTILDNPSKVVQEAELLNINEQVEEQVISDTSNNDNCQPILTLFPDDNTNGESGGADLSINNIGPAQTGEIALLSNDFDGDIESKVGASEDEGSQVYVNDAKISIEENTSIEIRGPPLSEIVNSEIATYCADSEDSEVDHNILDEYAAEMQPDGTIDLPGLYLFDPSVNCFNGQIIYLDFDGAQDVTYNGPVVVEGIDIPVFSAESAGLAGQEQEIINQVIAELEQTYAGTGIIFTTLQPTQGSEYSTIYIGGDDSAFSEYGSFLGLAETVDVGNRNRADDGFVFSDELFWISLDTSQLVGTIAHEVGHLLGYSHFLSHPLSGELSEFAATTTQSISLSATDEPIWAGGVGFDKSVTVWDWSPSSLPWTVLGYGITDLNTSLSARAYASTGTVSVDFGGSLDISYPDSVQPGQQNVPLTISAGLSPGTMNGVLGAGIDIPLTFGISWQLPWPLPDGNLDFTVYLEDVLGMIGLPVPPDISLNTSANISPQFGTTNTASGSATVLDVKFDLIHLATYIPPPVGPIAIPIDLVLNANLGVDLQLLRDDNFRPTSLQGNIDLNGSEVGSFNLMGGSSTIYVDIPLNATNSISLDIEDLLLANTFNTSFGLGFIPYFQAEIDVLGIVSAELYRYDFPGFSVPLFSLPQKTLNFTLTDPPAITIPVVEPGNNPPVANDDAYVTDEDTTLAVTAPGVLGNDSDTDSDPLTAVLVSGPSSGLLTLNVDGSFTYTPSANFNGIDSFTYKANDGALDSNIATVTIDVNPVNDAPIAQIDSILPIPVDEGDTVSLMASFSDPDSGDTHTAEIDWGDGTVKPGVVYELSGEVYGNHVYADNNTYTVLITVMDYDGASNSDTLMVTVNNVLPIVNASPDQATNEGQAISLVSATFNDKGTLDTHTATIDWGDGTALDTGVVAETPFGPPGSTSGADGTVSGSHVYADDGTYTVTVTVMDSYGESDFDQFTITVLNVAPTLTLSAIGDVDEGSVYTLNLASEDPGEDTISSWEINWGDGAVETVVGNPSSVDHVYADGPNIYLISAQATDEDGTYSANTVEVTVHNVTPTITLTGPAGVEEGGAYVLTLGVVTDPGKDTVTEYIVYWGDGGTDMYSSGGDVTHGYADGPADHTILVDLVDEDGTYPRSATLDVQVTNVAPSLADTTFELEENSPNGTVVDTASGTDPGYDTLTYSIVGGTGESAFAIDGSSGQITVSDATQLDYETTPSFTLEVQVVDDDNAEDTATVTINLLNQASITGNVFVDVNGNGVYEVNEPGIDGITIELLDENGVPVLDNQNNPVKAITSDGGFYLFEDLDPGTYQLCEVQPTGVDDGVEIIGSLGGTIPANDTMRLTLERIDATDYIFAELGQSVASGDTATIGFWQNKHGQALIRQGGAALADWLTNNFGNVFGDTFVGGDGDDVASFYRDQLFRQKSQKSAGPAKADAQFMAVALATYFTSSNLAGNVASAYGFNVTDTGIGTKLVNIGDNGTAFSVSNGTDLTIMQLLLATDNLTDQAESLSGSARIYDLNGDGEIDEYEAVLRRLANDVFSSINELGDIF